MRSVRRRRYNDGLLTESPPAGANVQRVLADLAFEAKLQALWSRTHGVSAPPLPSATTWTAP